jgi:hypothetical protein
LFPAINKNKYFEKSAILNYLYNHTANSCATNLKFSLK